MPRPKRDAMQKAKEYNEIVSITDGRPPEQLAQALKEAAETPKKKGWPKGKKRGPRNTTIRQETIRDSGVIAKTKKVRTRKGLNYNKFHVDPAIIPSGMDYQWNAVELLGMPQRHRRVGFEANGWEAVPASRHDGLFMPAGYNGEINIEGLVLMERPMELSEEARQEDFQRAVRQVADKEKQIGVAPQGTLTRSHPSVAPQIKKTVERLAVPEK